MGFRGPALAVMGLPVVITSGSNGWGWLEMAGDGWGWLVSQLPDMAVMKRLEPLRAGQSREPKYGSNDSKRQLGSTACGSELSRWQHYQDTISLRRASLKPETIRVLMLVKRKLILAHEMNKVKLDK